MRALIYILFLSLPSLAIAQAIDNNISYRNISSDNYFRLNYENDFFSATDYYYTQGICLELVSPSFKKFPLSKLLVHPHSDNIRYGISLQHNAYTPTSISSTTILYGNRPFAADLFLNTSIIASDSARKDRFTSSLSTGVIGWPAGGFEMQHGIHHLINGIYPRGWQYQIGNDAVLNYQVVYEKNLLMVNHNLAINGYGMARLGTLSDKASVGLTFMVGSFNSPFQVNVAGNKLRIYAYDHPMVSAIGYDATLQGGPFSQSSDPYTIPTGDVSRITFQNRYGFVLTYKWLYLEYYQAYVTPEFDH